MENIIANAISSKAGKAGSLYARSEIDALEALQLFAESVGTDPTYEVWTRERKEWIDFYVLEKPKAKGNSADQAFSRFVKKLNEAYGLTAPRAQTEASIKKAEERAKKAEALETRFSGYDDTQIMGMLQKAYQDQAKNPANKSSVLKDLEAIYKIRNKKAQGENAEALKALRSKLFALARTCDDLERLEAACDILDALNYEIKIEAD